MRAIAQILVAAMSAASLMGAAMAAHAESPPATPALSITSDNLTGRNILADQNHWNGQPARRSLQWDEKGRWGLKLDMSQPVGRDLQLQDVQAGAYYRLTPSLRVGGAVSLGDSVVQQPAIPTAPPQGQAPRVRLETSFKF
jgi:opacity protein-like surface antigen